MLLQSLFFTIFSFVLAAMFASIALIGVHSLDASRTEMQMLTAADRAVEHARASADADMQRYSAQEAVLPLLSQPTDVTDASGSMIARTSIDAALTSTSASDATGADCTMHDSEHSCNLSHGSAVAERRVWETIDVRTLANSGQVATLRRHVLLRLLSVRPFALVVAIRDDAVAGSKLLGDPAGFPAAATDASKPQADGGVTFHDTRIHVYEPCRFLSSNNPAISTDQRVWANWQGSRPGVARQNACDTGAGEITTYQNVTRSAPSVPVSPWGH